MYKKHVTKFLDHFRLLIKLLYLHGVIVGRAHTETTESSARLFYYQVKCEANQVIDLDVILLLYIF